MSISEYVNWLKRDWAKTGLIVSIFLFVFLFVFVLREDFVVFLILLQTPLYMLHEAEEYVFPGGFGAFFNMDIFKLDSEDGPVNRNFIFYVNVILIWIVLPGFGLLSTIDYQFGLWIPYFSFFAGIAHIALAIRAKKLYNPGMVVSLLLNIPVGLWSIIYLVNNQIIKNAFLNPHMLIGLGINALLPVMGVILLRRHKTMSTSI
jgi:hypothetical protein